MNKESWITKDHEAMYQIIKDTWNKDADEYSQWDDLCAEEQVLFTIEFFRKKMDEPTLAELVSWMQNERLYCQIWPDFTRIQSWDAEQGIWLDVAQDKTFYEALLKAKMARTQPPEQNEVKK